MRNIEDFIPRLEWEELGEEAQALFKSHKHFLRWRGGPGPFLARLHPEWNHNRERGLWDLAYLIARDKINAGEADPKAPAYAEEPALVQTVGLLAQAVAVWEAVGSGEDQDALDHLEEEKS